MKLPEYSLKYPVKHRPPDAGFDDEIEFLPGTLVFVFWNETLLPDHIRKLLDESKKPKYIDSSYGRAPAQPEEKKLMCIIGRHWVLVPKSYIRSNR